MRLATSSVSLVGIASLALLAANSAPFFAAPTDVQQPGTQPLEAFLLGGLGNCDGCHGYYDPNVEPVETWMGSMMAQAGRDPVFWATLAVAEGDFPGAGDFCLRCHSPRGWHEGRTTATDGSTLNPATDSDGLECAICHSLVNPNKQEHPGIQNWPYGANDGGSPATGYYGSGMQVMAGNFTRYGPYNNAAAGHAWAQSQFHRSTDFCGTCHDVSNPVVGDLAPNNGAQIPLAPGTFSGVPGAPVDQKAAFNNFPYQYGVVERTYSEMKASQLSTMLVASYPSLPADLQRGALKRAYDQSMLAGMGGDYEDGSPRYFNCQVCHMEPNVGEGAAFGIAPLRHDLASHDLTGGNTWVPNAIQWLDNQVPSRLRMGSGITPVMSAAMDRGVLRARASLKRAGALDLDGNTLRVTNLTGHKLISGYPEGRRMWLRTTWRDEQNNVLREDGSYDTFTATVNGTPYSVQSITSPTPRVYEAKYGITQDWALQLLGLGISPLMPLAYDRTTGAVTMTLAQLASMPAGAEHETFRFVLNNKVISDNRIPPYLMARNEAATRNVLPVPATQFGNPSAGGHYDHFDNVPLSPPAGATRADIELLYQTSSWEYIQFLLLANPGTSAFLANVGQDLFDAWRNTGMSPPEVMAKARWCNLPGTNEDLVLESGINNGPIDGTCGKMVLPGDTMHFRVRSPLGTHQAHIGGLFLQLHDPWAPPLSGILQGLHIDHSDGYVMIVGVPGSGWNFSLPMPAGVTGILRWQALMITDAPANGLFALTDAHDIWQP
ncbi:MAG: hypothetical protein K8J09_17770 [Planctomycetes bacterium]|nr:hypothetical protein [Planctomycetota bacterium]MCC7396909.1 hypothetical protein [Planctomycetota bacterium]